MLIFHLLVVLFMTSISQSYLGWTSRPSPNLQPKRQLPMYLSPLDNGGASLLELGHLP